MQMASVSEKFFPDSFAIPSKNYTDSFDFSEAINSLNKFQMKLEMIVHGIDTNRCEFIEAAEIDQSYLTCWLQGAGKESFGNLKSFHLLEISHLIFRDVVTKIISKTQSGDLESATDLLNGEFKLYARLM